MNIDLGAGRRIEGYKPGMDSRDTVTLVSPTRRYEVTLGAVLVQIPDLKLPDENVE